MQVSQIKFNVCRQVKVLPYKPVKSQNKAIKKVIVQPNIANQNQNRKCYVKASTESQQGSTGQDFVPAIELKDLPKGERKVALVDGKEVLFLWYRNNVYAVSNRSPCEGAYTTGMVQAKLSEDGSIECPSTQTKFDLKTGEIREWYPSNFIMGIITSSTKRNLVVYEVKQEGDTISVDMSRGGADTRYSKGGSDTSNEGNNVYSVEPEQYVQDDSVSPQGTRNINTQTIATLAVFLLGALAVGGVASALAIYIEAYNLIPIIWVAVTLVSVAQGFSFFKNVEE